MGTFHSLRKVVKETTASTCTRLISVEDSSDGIAVKVNEFLTNWWGRKVILREERCARERKDLSAVNFPSVPPRSLENHASHHLSRTLQIIGAICWDLSLLMAGHKYKHGKHGDRPQFKSSSVTRDAISKNMPTM